nr:hypothetical protein GCM10020093_040480 [Planobispora longispora]
MRALLEAGADPARPDGEGDTPLAIAYDWLGTQLESALLEQVSDHVTEDTPSWWAAPAPRTAPTW